MFDLEQSIAEWRQQMMTAGIKKPALLEELEGHLREEMERHMRAGFNASYSFDIAVEQIGKPQSIKTEFTKVERNSMKRSLYILLGIFGVLFGMALVLPAMAWFRHNHTMHAEQLTPFLIGLGIVTGGVGSTIYGLKKRNA
jgi:hypothetical protein